MKLLWSLAAVAGLWLLAGARPSPADQPVAPTPQEHEKAAALVKQLGEKSFRVRERAARELLKLGLKAKRALAEGARSGDVEVRNRCRDLLVEVEHAGLRARLDAFLADKDGKREHDLPGWKLYRELVGNDAEARRFFVEAFLANLPLLQIFEKDPRRAGAVCSERCQEMQRGLGGFPTTGPEINDLAPLFLVASDPRSGSDTTPAYALAGMLYRQGPRQAMTAAGPPSPFKRLVLAWMGRQSNDHATGYILDLAMNLNLKEAVDIAARVARDRKAGPHARAHALVVLGKHEGKKHTELFESFLKDAGNVSSFGIGNDLKGQTQVRDVALAMLVHVGGQKHVDYNFTFSRGNHGSLMFHAAFLGFTTPQERDAAFKKWEEKAKPKK